MEPNELRAALEAILFVNNEPVTLDDLAASFDGVGREAIVAQIDEIKRILDANVGGFTLEQTAGGWRLATRPEHDAVLKKYYAQKGQNRLTIAALETLAIVAYRQPITAPEISEIRSVNSTQTIRTLLERRMIRVAGRKNVVGSPFLYRTTKDFLVHFGLNDVRDMPRLEEFGDLIGETINEDLVAAIAEAPQTSDSEVTEPATMEEAAAHEAAALDELAREEVQSTVSDSSSQQE
jgi:segregation and condensation protein B